jgi:hypothetical protein
MTARVWLETYVGQGFSPAEGTWGRALALLTAWGRALALLTVECNDA